ncbi:Prokaryotic membrane lipoprotein lipid attachment site profile-containing protein [Cardinium endosymbiont of Oedothorax gibbosus]|nr:Prokaryotic membrane lipoprotein lipid attachment site profile-containing protein [Cardinium endosymbiont of Oedothorax gibbosus]
MIKIYGNKKYAFISLTVLLLWFFSFSLQSCSSIGRNKSNITPITSQDLLGQAQQANEPLIRELVDKIDLLEQSGFVGGVDPNHNDIRKHFMFVFHHSLTHRQNNIPLQNRLAFFQNPNNVDAQNLVWNCRQVNITNRRTGIQRQVLEFRLRNLLFSANAPAGNLHRAREGRAPDVLYNGVLESVEIDHLLKNNDIVIELPQALHQQKTLLIDNLVNPPQEGVIRDARSHWTRRANLGHD